MTKMWYPFGFLCNNTTTNLSSEHHAHLLSHGFWGSGVGTWLIYVLCNISKLSWGWGLIWMLGWERVHFHAHVVVDGPQIFADGYRDGASSREMGYNLLWPRHVCVVVCIPSSLPYSAFWSKPQATHIQVKGVTWGRDHQEAEATLTLPTQVVSKIYAHLKKVKVLTEHALETNFKWCHF